MSPAQYIEAKRYLNQLSAAIKALSDPKVANYFNNRWNAKGKNVAELVSHMKREGLAFVPATPGDEAAYAPSTTPCATSRRAPPRGEMTTLGTRPLTASVGVQERATGRGCNVGGFGRSKRCPGPHGLRDPGTGSSLHQGGGFQCRFKALARSPPASQGLRSIPTLACFGPAPRGR